MHPWPLLWLQWADGALWPLSGGLLLFGELLHGQPHRWCHGGQLPNGTLLSCRLSYPHPMCSWDLPRQHRGGILQDLYRRVLLSLPDILGHGLSLSGGLRVPSWNPLRPAVPVPPRDLQSGGDALFGG